MIHCIFIDDSRGEFLPYTCPNCKEKAIGIINDKYCLKCYKKEMS